MRELTRRQQQILDLIREFVADTGFPPTRAEIAAHFGFRSANAAEEHLKALARKGVLELTAGASRGIRLTPQTDSRARPDHAAWSGRILPQRSLTQRELPLIGRVAAGSPILAVEHVERSYAIDPALFSEAPDYLLRVRGMSMRDAGILDGDLLAVRQAHEARNGQIVVARIGDDVTVKRWHRRGRSIELRPENPDFTPIVVDARADDFSLEGIAVGLLRNG